MVFDQTAPSSAYWTPPKTAQGWDKTRLALFGYGADGQQNGWGKLSSWIPGLGVGLNVAAQKDAKDVGLKEVSTNIGQDLDNRLQKLQTLVAVGQTAFSAATGNVAGVASGVQGITQGISGTMQAQDKNLALTGQQYYGKYKEGGKPTIYAKHDDTEDIHMIDKATGEKIGEMRYGERIFDQKATIKMEELADKKDDHALGRFLRKELATHSDRKGMQLFADGGKPKYNTAPSAGMNAMFDRFKNLPGPTSAQIEASKRFMTPSLGSDSPKTDWFGLTGDGLRSITSAIGASQELPTRPVNPNLLQMQRELADKQNEGLSAAERINLLRQKAATQAYEVQAIRDTAGGGGSAAAVLGATNKADLRANQMGVEIEQADAAQRAQNKQNYYSDLQTTQNQSDALYSQQYNNALNTRNAFATALGANLQNMADRNQYNQSYGEGSPYYNLMLQMMKRTGKTQAYADAPVTTGVLAKQV